MYQLIQDDINSFYVKYAGIEGITLAEAKKRVSKVDIEEYAAKAKRYVEQATKDRAANHGKTDRTASYFSDKANAEMRLYNATMKINRLELLKAHMGLELIEGHNELEKLFGDALTKRTLDEFKRQAGILGTSVKNNERLARSIVNASFHNADFSERIWTTQDLLRGRLHEILTQALINGLNPKTLTSRVMPFIKTELLNDNKKYAKYAANRLLRTELCRVQIDAQMKSYERGGFDKYIFLAEPTACPHCRALDDKVVDVKDAMPGDNAPPIHPNCRCSTAGYIESDEEYEKWFYERTGKHSAQWELDNHKKIINNDATTNKNGFRSSRIYHKRTANMSPDEYARALELWRKFEEIDVPNKEYIYSEFDRYLSYEQKESALVCHIVDDYYYYAVNKGHNQYKIYAKKPVEPYEGVVDEVLSEMFGRNWKREWEEIEKSKKNS